MIEDVLSGTATHHVACERAEAFIDTLPDGCVSLMTLDFPYYGVKDDAWDNAWPTPEAFIAWMGSVLAKCRRVLARNGSIYVFASPEMAGRVESEAWGHFAVLNHIIWRKPDGSGAEKGARAGLTRSYIRQTERVIFAEQRGDGALALSEVDYALRCDALRGEVFEPLRAYLDGERERAGLDRATCDRLCGNQMSGHYFSSVQWTLPTATNYEKLRAAAPGFFLRPWADLKREHDALRARYDCGCVELEHLRRPFTVSADVPYTDLWTYTTVNAYPGKHPCEKPEDMARDMVRASSRPGGLVADFFCGSGAFLAAAVAEGRRAIGCDMDPHWAEQARLRCEAVRATGRIPRTAAPKKNERQMGLFGKDAA